MFDVPPPFMSRGLDAYMATWDTFFAGTARPVQFDLRDIAITASHEAAFATALGRCCDLSSGAPVQLDFRLTLGFSRQDGRWRIVHEHHSVPAGS
jgi:ketosteroid isomerase-like protein